jgi:hypothetical protein
LNAEELARHSSDSSADESDSMVGDARSTGENRVSKIKGRGTRGWITTCLHMVFGGTSVLVVRAALLRKTAPVLCVRRADPYEARRNQTKCWVLKKEAKSDSNISRSRKQLRSCEPAVPVDLHSRRNPPVVPHSTLLVDTTPY